MAQQAFIEDAYPLTPMQEGMLYHSLNAEGGVQAYVVQMCCRIDGLNSAVWRTAWTMTLARQPALRSAFAWKSQKHPIQIVGSHADLPWSELDWTGLSDGEVEARLEGWREQDRRQVYDLARASLMRLTLARASEGLYWFLWSFHHILLDAWSASKTLAEVLNTYEALVNGRRPELRPAPRFRDYVQWLGSRDRDRMEQYWRRILEGFAKPSSIAFSPTQNAPRGRGFGQENLILSRNESAAINTFTRASKITSNTLFRAAWGLLLSRYTAEGDVLFGAAVSGRPPDLALAEDMIGLFMNTIPVRMRIPSSDTVLAWLQILQREAAEASEYDYGSLAQIQRYSAVSSRQALFESILIFENLPESFAPATHKTTLRIDRRQSWWLTTYPLSLMVVPGPELKLQITYDAVLYRPANAAQLMRHWVALVRGIVLRPHDCSSKIPMLSADEQACAHLIGPRASLSFATFTHDMIAAQAKITPDRLAVEGTGRALTYAKLQSLSRIVALNLIARGIKRGDRAGVCMQRSPDLVIALLAVLRTGAAFVPMDPEIPPARLAHMASDAACRFIVTDSASANSLRACASERLLVDALVSPADGNLPAISRGDIAYVIYTSGSSGFPKGVEIRHEALANLLGSMRVEPGICDSDRLLAVTTVSFDIAALELFLPLIAGATVVIAPPAASRDPQLLGSLLETSRATILQATPSTWNLLTEAGWKGRPGLKALCGGEPLTSSLAARLTGSCGEVWNLYGPTETTIWSMVAKVEAGCRIVLGKPVANTEILLLDARGNQVPPDIPGEVHIGGLGLAKGYLGAEELTGEKFISSPLTQPGTRLFRTGDHARFDAHHGLEFIGRIDSQYKVRGFRVEAGEIETLLERHSSVRKAAVGLHEIGGAPVLVAYVVPSVMSCWDPSGLRTFLQTHLPDYMIPALFVLLDRLPTTWNGKLDRSALPKPDEAQPARHTGRTNRPKSPVQEVMETQWGDLLGVSNAGRQDDFFQLGGHSLSGMRLISRLNKAFGLQLPTRTLFENPTFGSLQERIEVELRRRSEDAWECPVEALGDGSTPLSHQQQRVWFVEHLQTDPSPYNLHVAVRIQGKFDITAAERSFSEIVSRHAILRTRFFGSRDGPMQLAEVPQRITIPKVDLRCLPTGERECRAGVHMAALAAERFDLERAGGFRTCLVQLDEEEYHLLLVLHHIVADEWSFAILMNEFANLYEGFVNNGNSSPPAQLPVQYADFVRWQMAQSRRPMARQQLEYWRNRLAGLTPPNLPFSRRRRETPSFLGASLIFQLPGPLLMKLKQTCRQEGATLFVALLACFRCLLQRCTGSNDVVIGTLLAGRDRPEFEPLIGFFSNTIALRTEIQADATFRQILRNELDGLLSAWANSLTPFELIVDALGQERNLNRNPVFQVMFVLQNTPVGIWEFGSLRLTPLRLDSATAEFDMLLELFEDTDGIRIRFNYNRELFDESAIQRLAQQYLVLVEAASNDPGILVSALPLSEPAEWLREIQEFNEPLEPDIRGAH